jgi:predicted PurR-regulated permease PerM
MEIKLPGYAKFTIALLVIIMVLWIMMFAQSVLLPLAFAGLISLLLLPVCNFLERWNIPRGLSVFISILLMGVVVSFIVWFFSSQIVGFTASLPSFTKQLRETLENSEGIIETYFGVEPGRQIEWLKQSLLNLIQRSSSLFTSTLSTTATAFTALALIPIYIFFLLYYRDFYLQFLFYILKGNEEEEVEEVVHQIQKVVQNYLTGLLMVIFIVAVANSIGLMVLGVKHAIFFGTLAGVLNIIPYIGVLIGSLLPILYTALTMNSWFYPIMVAVIFWGIQTLEGNVITPYVVGSKVRINPLAAILALIIGGLIWGPAGMIIFIPFIAILKVVLDAVPSTRAYGFVLGLPKVEKQPTSPPQWIETLKETTGLSTPKNVQEKKDEE